jgi:hypothetical protein
MKKICDVNLDFVKWNQVQVYFNESFASMVEHRFSYLVIQVTRRVLDLFEGMFEGRRRKKEEREIERRKMHNFCWSRGT